MIGAPSTLPSMVARLAFETPEDQTVSRMWSSFDEINKLLALRDLGVLTHDQFEQLN